MKYIAFEGPMHQEIILFVESRKHNHVFQDLGLRKEDLLGAGFVSSSMNCWGKSTSLGIPSRGDEDTAILRRMLKMDDDD